jgi:hypothetical protein
VLSVYPYIQFRFHQGCVLDLAPWKSASAVVFLYARGESRAALSPTSSARAAQQNNPISGAGIMKNAPSLIDVTEKFGTIEACVAYLEAMRWPEGVRCPVCLHFGYYNFCRIHSSLRVTPAMEAGIADHVWTLQELLA